MCGTLELFIEFKMLIINNNKSNGFNIISDGLEAKAGSLSAGHSRYMAWKSADGLAEASHLVSQLETLIAGMLNKETLLYLIRHFIVFEETKKTDNETGIISISTVKKLATYHQYYAVNRAVESTMRASGFVPTLTPLSIFGLEYILRQANFFSFDMENLCYLPSTFLIHSQ